MFVLVGVPIGAALSALPQPGAVRGYALPILAVVWVLILGAGGLFLDRPDARTPYGSSLAYVVDADRGEARWVTADQAPAPWIRSYAGSARAPLGRLARRRARGHRTRAAAARPRPRRDGARADARPACACC